MDGVISKKQKAKQNMQSQQKSVAYDFEYTPKTQSTVTNPHNTKERYHVYQLGKVIDEVDEFDDVEQYSEFNTQKDNYEDSIYNNTFQNQQSEKKYTQDSYYHETYDTEEEMEYDDEFNDDVFETYESDFYEEEVEDVRFSLRDLSIFSQDSILMTQRVKTRFVFFAAVATIILGGTLFVGTTLAVKERVDGAGQRAISSIKGAMVGLNTGNFALSGDRLAEAHQEFVFASEELDKINGFVTFISQFVPGASKLSSGTHIIEAGKYLTHSAKELNSVIPVVLKDKQVLISEDSSHISFLALYQMLADHMEVASNDISQAKEHIDKVHLDDVPSEYRDVFVQMRDTLPLVDRSLSNMVVARPVIEDLLGAKRKKTYLFLFQNNNEMRATGGFIGSYGILEIKDGEIKKIVVDDIFNPDGQLIDKVVPPLPIQKISANWSLHDSNWFVDFPLSAKKAMDFYERTGGPTVDGVIAITPAMLEKFLLITGPVALPEHGVILTNNNVIEVLQSEVEDEDNYCIEGQCPQEQNQEEGEKDITNAKEDEKVANNETEAAEEEKKQPKKILSDLMPIIVDRLSDRTKPEDIAKMVDAISSGLKERHIVMYMSNKDAQAIIENNGWSGSVLQTDKDYLSVINSNINGFKTDGVIDEYITHTAEIDVNGDIVDTVKVHRIHNGGKTGYPWWDAVNANYMRIYVPQGSELLSVEGQTREINEERLDYDALGYERDKDVEREEKNMYIDEETGTRIYDEFNKTVFANWVYVSPQETVTITYKYKLPFKADFNYDSDGKFGSYAVLFQKQSGSKKSHITSEIKLDDSFSQIWNSDGDDDTTMENKLNIDRYHGTVFRVNE